MRTTLTLDDDLIQRLKQVAHRDGKPFKVVLNETLRAGFGNRDIPKRKAGRTVLRTFRSRLKAGIDESKLNQLVDQIEVESFLAETFKPPMIGPRHRVPMRIALERRRFRRVLRTALGQPAGLRPTGTRSMSPR